MVSVRGLRARAPGDVFLQSAWVVSELRGSFPWQAHDRLLVLALRDRASQRHGVNAEHQPHPPYPPPRSLCQHGVYQVDARHVRIAKHLHDNRSCFERIPTVRRQSVASSELLPRLLVYGLVAKIPRTRRWRVTAFDHRVMSASVRLRQLLPCLLCQGRSRNPTHLIAKSKKPTTEESMLAGGRIEKHGFRSVATYIQTC